MSAVFLSYRQENDHHCQRVRELANRLECERIRVIFDQFAEQRDFHCAAPPRGWALWSIQQAASAPSVLVIASSGWFRVINDPTEIKDGKGAAAEAETVVHRLYRKSGRNDFSSIAYFDEPEDLAQLPLYLDKLARFDVTKLDRFERLVAWIHRPVTSDQLDYASTPENVPSLGFPQSLPPIDRSRFLDGGAAFAAFQRLVARASCQRIMLLEAEGEHGKSDLMTRFFDHAQSHLPANSVGFIRLSQPVREPARHLADLADAFGFPTLAGTTLYERTRMLLAARSTLPTVIFVDGFEHAKSEHAEWLDNFLDRTLFQTNLRLIIAGRSVPRPGKLPWAIYAEHIHCDPLAEPAAFIQHGADCGSTMTPHEIEYCCGLLRRLRNQRKLNGQPTDGFSPLALLTEIGNHRAVRHTL